MEVPATNRPAAVIRAMETSIRAKSCRTDLTPLSSTFRDLHISSRVTLAVKMEICTVHHAYEEEREGGGVVSAN